MSTLILVHGSWHGAWCWFRVIPRLQRLGHRVLAPDLPGHGRDRTPLQGLRLGDYVEAIVRVVQAEPQPVVLVGHSMAGMLIAQVAEQVPEHLRRLVYVAAFMPRDGDSLTSLSAGDPDSLVTRSTIIDEQGLTARIRDESLREVFYHDCTDEDVALACRLVSPEPLPPLTECVNLSPRRAGRVPAAYIECRQDRALILPLQQAMHEAAGCQRIAALETGHSPFFAAPDELADRLHQLSETNDAPQ